MEKEKKNKKQVIIGVSALLLVTLLLLGLTYAYYRTRIVGNSNSESISVTSKNLEVEYDDNNAQVITDTGISPGKKITKSFKVKNNGDGEATFSIKFDNVTNDFIRISDWTYKLYKGTEATGETLAEGIIGHGEEQTIKSYETVGTSQPNDYTLEIEYLNLETEDQSIDMGATLSLRVNIGNSIGDELRNADSGTLLHAIGEDNPNIISPITIPGKEASGIIGNVGVMGETIHYMFQDYWISTDYHTYEWAYGTGYEYNPETGKYNLTGVQTGVYSQIYSQLPGKYFASTTTTGVSSWSEVSKSTTNLSMVYQVVEATEDKLTYKKLVKDFKEAELSYTEDDYGTSYYYRGAVENNYVNFGNMCWRIVRVQGDGSIKIVLADESHTCENISAETSTSAFIDGIDGIPGNITSDGLTSGDYSEWSIGLETWMKKKSIEQNANIKTNAEWCNDNSILEEIYYDSNYHITPNKENAIVTGYHFGAGSRLASPSLKCDFVGVNNSKSNKYQKGYALLNYDELLYAGYVNETSVYYPSLTYLNSNASQAWATMTPIVEDPLGPWTYILAVSDGTVMETQSIPDGCYARPSVTLKSTTRISKGNGTQQTPYVVE